MPFLHQNAGRRQHWTYGPSDYWTPKSGRGNLAYFHRSSGYFKPGPITGTPIMRQWFIPRSSGVLKSGMPRPDWYLDELCCEDLV